MRDNNRNITLAIETAVTGGSLALLKGGREIDLWIGGDGISRSEDLLVSISEILRRNSIDRSELMSVAVSTGPGSYTGIRVGIATALGLKNALGIECVGIQILEAMAVARETGELISAIPVGREEVCWQLFGPAGGAGILVDSVEAFAAYLAENGSSRAILHEKIFRQISVYPGFDTDRVIDAGDGLARFVGLAAQSREMGNDMMPTYVRDFI